MNKVVNIFGKDINVYFEKERFINDVIINHEYKRLFENITVVDIGANIGTFSFWIYPFAGRIYAIEPTNAYYTMLETIKHNKLDKIKAYECAISSGTGKRWMKGEVNKDGHGGEWSFKDSGGNFTKEVQTYSLKEFMDKEGINYIDILKIDTEGAEYEILNAGDFPKDRVHTIIGECHGDTQAVVEKLEELGFTIQVGLDNFLAKRL
jgi:FkbM family methyltransferase